MPQDKLAIAEAIDALRLQIDDLSLRIERQEKRAQKIQVTTPTASRRSEPAPASEAQAVLAEMVGKRTALQSELEVLEAQQSAG
jgi:hypothetical protein